MIDNEFGSDREPVGRKPGATSGTTMRRETPTEKVKEGWQEFKAKVRQKWSQLTDKDIESYRSRNRDDFVVYVFSSVGGDRTLIERDIDTFARDTNYRW